MNKLISIAVSISEWLQPWTSTTVINFIRLSLRLFVENSYFLTQLDEQQDEVEKVRLDMEDLRARNAELESKIRLQKSMDSIKWEEFERMADSLKEFSRSMTPHRSARTIEFDT